MLWLGLKAQPFSFNPPNLMDRAKGKMRNKFFKLLLAAAGWTFVIVGLLGLFLPVLPGVLFLIAGLFLLSKDNLWAQNLVEKLKGRYPEAFMRFEHFRRTIERYFHNTSIRQLLFSPALLSLLGLCFFWALVYFDILIKNKFYSFGEIARFYLPGHKALAAAWQHGHLLLWAPQLFGGFPLYAAGQLGAFYPLNILLHAFFAPEYAVSLLLIFHILLASLFTYLYTRQMGLEESAALVASVVFAFGGFLTTNLMHVSLIFASAWFPLGLYFIEKYIQERRRSFLVWFSLAVALQALAGNQQILLFSIIVYIAYFAWFWSREKLPFREAAYFTGLVLLGLSLAAVQLVPYRELLLNGVRSGKYDCGATYFPLRNFITYIFPNFFGWQSPSASPYYYGLATYWDLACYIGIAPLILALVALMFRLTRHLNFFIFLLIGALVLSFGHHPDGISGCLMIGNFSLAVLAGFGLKIILLKKERFSLVLKRVYVLTSSFMLLAFGLGYGLILLGKERLAKIAGIFSQIPLSKLVIWADQLVGGLQYSLDLISLHVYTQLIILFLVYWIIKGFLEGEIKAPAFQLILIGIIMCDLYYFGLGYNVTTEKNQVSPSYRVLNILKTDPDYFRIYNYRIRRDSEIPGPEQGLTPNMNLLWEVDEINGYSPWELTAMNKQLREIEQQPIPQFLPALGRWNVKYVITTQKIVTAGLKLVFQDAQTYMYENLYFKERAYYLQHKQDLPIIAYSHNHEIKIYTNLLTPDKLVLRNTFYPGWAVSVDGVPALLEREAGMFQAVAVPAGKHEVLFYYQPRSLRIGAFMSVGAVVIFLSLLLSKFSKRI
ncbi:MAG: hypothetical protein HY920_01005 [Elusimicrobia bacterium]|nr:hypothetical protein [Elusimicrobiota bacterium]